MIRLAQIVVGAGLLALLWHVADGPAALRLLSGADPVWLIAAFLALGLQTVLSALRWRLTAAPLGITLTARKAIGEYYLAQVVNQSLPGGMIGDAGRAVRARGQAGLLASGQAVVFERLAGQIAMFVVMTAAFGITLALPGGVDWPAWLIAPVAVIVAVGLTLPLVLAAATRMPGRVGAAVAGFWRALRLALMSRWRVQVMLSLGTTLCNLAAFAFCARAVDAGLPLVAVLALVPLILFTMLIPFTISGWGIREGAAAALFPIAGATASDGLATSIAFGLTFLVAVVPGVIPLLLRPEAQAMKPAADHHVDI